MRNHCGQQKYFLMTNLCNSIVESPQWRVAWALSGASMETFKAKNLIQFARNIFVQIEFSHDAIAAGDFLYFQLVLAWHFGEINKYVVDVDCCCPTTNLFFFIPLKWKQQHRQINIFFLVSSHGNWFAFEFFLFEFSTSTINEREKENWLLKFKEDRIVVIHDYTSGLKTDKENGKTGDGSNRRIHKKIG